MPERHDGRSPLRDQRAAGWWATGAALLISVLFSVIAHAAGVANLPQGDPQRGSTIYERCQACHSLDRNRTGPKHCGLLGRAAGSVDDYRFSPALRNSGIVWSVDSLDRFLENPLKTVPGTRMGYAGVKNPQERADLIAYLATVGACGKMP